MRRRDFLKVAGGAAAGVSAPIYLRTAWAQGPIKIGMPAALSSSNAQYGIQARRTAELCAMDIKAKGILGRPVEFIYEDTGGDPATAVRKAHKEVVGTDFPPVGTKDFASYIAKIRQSRADGVYLALPGQDATIYLKQAHQFGLNREVKPIMEILELENMKAVGDAMVGAIGSSRYPFTVDTPKNRDFVKRFHDLHGIYPDMFDGETYEGLEWLAQVIGKAGTDDVEKVIDAWEGSSASSTSRTVSSTCWAPTSASRRSRCPAGSGRRSWWCRPSSACSARFSSRPRCASSTVVRRSISSC